MSTVRALLVLLLLSGPAVAAAVPTDGAPRLAPQSGQVEKADAPISGDAGWQLTPFRGRKAVEALAALGLLLYLLRRQRRPWTARRATGHRGRPTLSSFHW